MARTSRVQTYMNKTADYFRSRRQPPGSEQVTVPNPGNKLVGCIGRPESVKLVKDEFFTHAECVFTLPLDWHKVDPPERSEEHHGLIVARRDNSPQVMRVADQAANGFGMTEVLN